MDRRHLVVPGAILMALVVASGFLGVVAWDSDLSATDRNLESADRTTVEALPSECRGFARTIAGSGTVSMDEYRIVAGSDDAVIVVRRVAGERWWLGSTACTPRLRSENNLHVGTRSVNVLGSVTRTTIHHEPTFRGVQILLGVAGGVCVFVGVTRY
jgi:hypothetical protein